MITAFHTVYIIARYVYIVLSESLNCLRGNGGAEHSSESTKYQVSSESFFEEGFGPRFVPPLYVQRYLTVKLVLEDEKWKGNIRKVVDFGCANFGFFSYLKRLAGVQEILEVDVDHEVLMQHCCRVSPLNCDYLYQRNEPLTVLVLEGSIAHTDEYLVGCDAVVCIELIEHLYPDVLEEIPYTVFGVIKPRVAIFTTPNGEFNVLFPNSKKFRHPDHKFEWTRAQFENWANNIAIRYSDYKVSIHGIGWGPPDTENVGTCSQMAVFERQSPMLARKEDFVEENRIEDVRINGTEQKYQLLRKNEYPFHVDTRTEREKILDQAVYSIKMLSSYEEFMEEDQILIPLTRVLPFLNSYCVSIEELQDILKETEWELISNQCGSLSVVYPTNDSPAMSEVTFDDDRYQDIQPLTEVEDHVFVENWDDFGPESVSEQKWDCDSIDLNCRSGDVSGNESDCSVNKEDISPFLLDKPVKANDMCKSNESVVSTSSHIPVSDSDSSNLNAHCSSSTAVKIQSGVGVEAAAPMETLCDGEMETQNSERQQINFVVLQDEQSVCDPSYSDIKSDKPETTIASGERLSSSGSDLVNTSASIPGTPNNSTTQLHCDRLDSLHRTADSKISESHHPTDISLSPNHTLYLNLLAESQSTNIETNKKHEGFSDSPAAGSISLEEPNDRLADSGYPNSTSAQEMDLDLTPEQVDELFTENDMVPDRPSDHHSDSISVSSRDSDSVSEAQQLPQPPPLLIPLPDVFFEDAMNVENGDVANNNRDGEGNNVMAVGALPIVEGNDPDDGIGAGIVLPENFEDLFPLFAAAEDIDNDNEIEIHVVEPFPPWLLNLIGLANGGNGGGGGGGGVIGVVGGAEDVGENVENNHRHESSDEEYSDNNHIVDEGLGDEDNVDNSSLSDTCPSDTGVEPDGSQVITAANP